MKVHKLDVREKLIEGGDGWRLVSYFTKCGFKAWNKVAKKTWRGVTCKRCLKLKGK